MAPQGPEGLERCDRGLPWTDPLSFPEAQSALPPKRKLALPCAMALPSCSCSALSLVAAQARGKWTRNTQRGEGGHTSSRAPRHPPPRALCFYPTGPGSRLSCSLSPPLTSLSCSLRATHETGSSVYSTNLGCVDQATDCATTSDESWRQLLTTPAHHRALKPWNHSTAFTLIPAHRKRATEDFWALNSTSSPTDLH